MERHRLLLRRWDSSRVTRCRIACGSQTTALPRAGQTSCGRREQTLSIVAAALPLHVRVSRARRSGLRGKLDALRKDVVAERGATDQLRQSAETAAREERPWDELLSRSIEEREAAARKIEDRLKLLARELEAIPAIASLREPLSKSRMSKPKPPGPHSALPTRRTMLKRDKLTWNVRSAGWPT